MWWGGSGPHSHRERKVALIVGRAIKGAVLCGESLRITRYKEVRV
jgi:hypothetical protein